MTRKQLISNISGSCSQSKLTVEEVLTSLSGEAIFLLAKGTEVPFPGGLGKLVVVETQARKARNPRTGKIIDVPAGRKVRFRPGKDLTEAMKG